MNTWTLVLFAFVSFACDVPPASQPASNQFTVESWNVESIRHDPHLPALHISQTRGVHLWGLAGVRNPWWAEMFRDAAAENGRSGITPVLSPTGGVDRLLILYDPRQFDLVRSFELDWEGEPWRTPYIFLRPALVAQLRHLASGQEFFFMMNSLNPDLAARQAKKLACWIREQSLPVIAGGTYWFQYNLGSRPLRCDGQAGLSTLLAGGIVEWVRPEELVKTYDGSCDTVEDFIFLANAAGRMQGRSRIVVGPGDFSGRRPTGAHRPVRATFTILPAAPEAQLDRRIREQAARVQAELRILEDLVRQLPE
ncbi:MAG: hypothetical protein ABFE01_26720 [Phycisphaerales bacterium]